MSNDEKKFQPIFQILHIKSAWFLLELAMALVTTIGMRFLQVWAKSSGILKVKQKLGRTFNSDKLGGIAFTKISKLTMCSA